MYAIATETILIISFIVSFVMIVISVCAWVCLQPHFALLWRGLSIVMTRWVVSSCHFSLCFVSTLELYRYRF